MNTPLESRDLEDSEKRTIRELYYENRLLLQDVADILGPMEAMRLYILKEDVDSTNTIPDPYDTELPDDKDFYNEIPEEVLDEIEDES